MNKIILIVCVVLSLSFIKIGLSLQAQVKDLTMQVKNNLVLNKHIRQKIADRQLMTPRSPKSISKAFNLVINEMRFLEGNSGTKMDLLIDKARDNEDMASHYVASEYQGVRKLAVLIQVNKFSNETDMGAVLNDIYQLELGTDFKATELYKAGDSLIVKGDVYGL